MRKIALIFLIGISAMLQANAQDENNYSNIKLFVYREGIIADNHKFLDTTQCDRLFRKTQQLVNQTGVAELGYSTFIVSPKLDVLSESVDQTGIGKVYLAECELNISIERQTVGGLGGASFKSYEPKRIVGSGSSKKEAISNAINSIRSSDQTIVAFLNSAKQTITAYFNAHCKDVLDQAKQALALKNYQLSIALYYSVPIKAPCYDEARQRSVGVYNTYLDDQCVKNLTRLKAYVAMALNDKKSYEDVMEIMNKLDPTTTCYADAVKEIAKIEKRFTEEQKQNWDFKKKQAQNETEVNKEKYKAIAHISNSYQPAPANTIIVAH